MIKPQQRLPLSKKTPEWEEENIRFFYNNCTGRNYSRAEITRLYKLAQGYFDEKEYTFVTDQLGVGQSRPELSGTPSKLTNMDIITPVLRLLLGEKTKRPNVRIAFAKNSDYQSQKAQKEKELWQQNIHLDFMNELIRNGLFIPGMTDANGQPVQEPKSKEEIDMEVNSLADWQSIMAQEALDYISHFNELDRNFREGFYDWLVTASAFSYKTVRYDDTVYEPVPPAEMEWLCSKQTRFIEDGDAVKRTMWCSANEILDKYRDLKGFKPEMIDDLERFNSARESHDQQKYYSQTEVFYRRMFGESPITMSNGDEIEVCHIVWRSMRKVLNVTGTNILGEEYTVQYDETYIPLEGETVREEWQSYPMEGYYMGGKYILGVGPVALARESMNNPSLSKLPYNGRIFHSREIRAKSTVEQGAEIQKMVNIAYFLLNKTLNKNKDKLTILPLSLIPDKPGWDEFTVMYYADALGYLFVDDADPANMQALQYVKTLDMSLTNYIQFMHNHIQQLKAEWEELAGISRQRKEGATNSSDTVGGTQLAISRSVISTEELFVEFDELEERDLQGLIDISDFAFVNGKKAMYISPDGKKKYLDINPESYQKIDKGVFVKNGGTEAEKLKEFKQSAFAFAQNQMKPSLVAKVIDSNNLEKLVTEMINAENELEARQQAAQEALNNIEQAKTEQAAAAAAADTVYKYYKVDSDNLTKREIALIEPTPQGDNGAVASKENIERQWQSVERDKALLKAVADKHKDETAIKVAGMNKNKYDK